ncbi:hypothetical protein NM208_g1508 [Fusarium decemcellulare]|uniref:Uncharacterized protein n=1 Tax=Fusarium decemcellulare TaxID=57161 RepID=A0ACC1SVM7_9HYPO|nr:hypothetical protein NM208_g1508 [Fusarium decemcellulare]
MLRQEDLDICRAALTASKKWSQSRMPAEFVDALICWFRRDQSQKPVTAGPTSILDRGLTSILRPMFFMAGCAEEESLEEIAIKAFGPPRSWTKDVADVVIGCLSNSKHGVKMAVLSALKEDPEAVATHIEAISTCVDVEYSPLRQHAIDIISEQKHLPQNTLERIAIRLCRPKEERIVRDKILRILTDNSYWIHFLRARSTETQKQGGEPQQLVDIGLAIVEQQDLEAATIAVLALGYHDQNLNRTAIDQIVRCLSHEQVVIRLASLDALARQSHLDLKDLQAISTCLEDSDHLVQLTAINALEGRSALADMEDALCSLVMRLKGANLDIQIAAKRLLRCQKSLSEVVFKTMVSCFEHESFHKLVFGYSPSTARKSDGVMPPFNEDLLVSIISHLHDTSWKVRWGVLALFDGQPKLPEMVLHAVIECLVDEEESVRRLAVQVLEGHRSDFNQTLYTALRTHLSHQNPQKREKVFHALWATADPQESLLDLIKEGLQDLDAGIRVAALEVWIERPNLSPKLHDAVATFCETLSSSDRRGRRKFLDMLYRHPNALVMDDRTLLAFATFLNDEDKMIREHTLDFLTRRQDLPREVLSKISAFPDALKDSRGAIFSLLKHGEAYATCLARTNVARLFELLLSRSYVTHLAWYAQDGQTHVETGNGVAHAPLENPRAFASAVKKARSKMGAPDVVVKVPRRWLGVEWR